MINDKDVVNSRILLLLKRTSRPLMFVMWASWRWHQTNTVTN